MDQKQASQVTTGLVVVAIGLMLLAGQFDSGWAIDFGRMWPLIFVVLGIGKLLSRGGLGGGLWFLFLAAIFLMHTYGILRLRHSWPLFIVLAGISVMFPKKKDEEREARRAAKRAARHGDPGGTGGDTKVTDGGAQS